MIKNKKTKNKPKITINFIGTDFLLVNKREVDKVMLHNHTFYEIEAILDGAGSVFVNDTEYEIKKGRVFILDPMSTHSINAENKVTLWHLSFMKGSKFDEIVNKIFYSATKVHDFDEGAFHQLISLMEIASEEMSKQNYSERLLALCFEAILTLVDTNIQKNDMKVVNSLAVDIIRYIQAHFTENITLDSVAKSIGVTMQYLSFYFQKKVGMGFKEYLTLLRITYAKELIDNFDMSLIDVCYACGFNSYSSFYRAFEKVKGITPQEYLKSKK